MTAEEMRVAVAEADGWKVLHQAESVNGKITLLLRPGGKAKAWEYGHTGLASFAYMIPDYPNDYNAIIAAIRSRTVDEQWAVFAELANIVDAELPAYMGTPAQYTEAFLRTVGRWPTGEGV